MTRLNPFNSESTDRGVSPVIGVILMVAITVILAAVIGSFVLGIGGDQETTPSATFELDADSEADNVTLRKTSGQDLAVDDLTVIVENTSDDDVIRYELAEDGDVDTFRTADTGTANVTDGGEEFVLQDEVLASEDNGVGAVDGAGFDVESGTDYRVTVVHQPSEGTIVDRTVRA